jgi:hypothetical protein
LIDTNDHIIQGDKLFSNFRTDPLNNAVEGNVSPSSVGDIDVQGITISGENGLRFSGPFLANGSDGERAFGRYTIQYDVTVLDSTFLISDIHHSFFFFETLLGNASITTRTATLPSEGPFAQLFSEVFSSGLIDESANLRDALAGIDVAVPSSTIFEIFTLKAIPIGLDFPGSAHIDFVDVTFSQIQAVAEPSTLALFVCGSGWVVYICPEPRDATSFTRFQQSRWSRSP